jgi:macrolide-specific efflux system membrane fusion protein
MSRKGRILAINGALVLVLGASAWGAYELLWPSTQSTAASDARHMAVLRTNVVETVSAAGTLQSGYTASADFATSGTVTEIDVKVGDVVAPGQILAKLDATEANQSVKAAQSSLDAAEEDLANAKAAAATTTTAPPNGQGGGGANSAQSVTSLQAKVDQAQLSLQQAKDARSACVLTAPGAGTVTAITGSVGQKVGSSAGSSSTAKGATGSSTTTSGFITLTDLANLVVKANVAEIDVSKVKAGQDASITVNALPDTPIVGKVISADLTPTTSNNIVQFGVSISLTQPPQGLRPGQSASVSITVARADNALAVPSAAVRTVGGTSTVTVLSGGQEETRAVEVGVRSEALVQITSGLVDGDQVVLTLPSTTSGGANGGFGGGGGGRQGGGGGFGGGGAGGGGAVIPGGTGR